MCGAYHVKDKAQKVGGGARWMRRILCVCGGVFIALWCKLMHAAIVVTVTMVAWGVNRSHEVWGIGCGKKRDAFVLEIMGGNPPAPTGHH